MRVEPIALAANSMNRHGAPRGVNTLNREQKPQLSEKPKILVLGKAAENDQPLWRALHDRYQVIHCQAPIRVTSKIASDVVGIVVFSGAIDAGLRLDWLLRIEQILEKIPDGVALLDADRTILWANDCLRGWLRTKEVVGSPFIEAFGKAEFEGPDFCPFDTSLATGEPSSSLLRCEDHHFFYIHCVPFKDAGQPEETLIVTVRDVTDETMQRQKMEAIHRAGVDLSELTADAVVKMEVEERIELLKGCLLYTSDAADEN